MARKKYAGKHKTSSGHLKKRWCSKSTGVLLSIFLLLSLAVSGTLAYLVAQTAKVDNQFEPSFVTCQVNANHDSTFDITNTGDVDAYIRAAIVVNWMDNNGNVRGISPAAGTDYEITTDASFDWDDSAAWFQDESTGYYYHKTPVIPNEDTSNLVTGIQVKRIPPTNYQLSVEVVAEAIQADGDTDIGSIPAVKDAWGISVYGN